MYRAIARNKRTTVFLIVGYILVVVGVGVGLSFLVNSIWPVIILSVFAALHVLWAWFRTGRLVDNALHAKKITIRDEPRLYRTVQTLAIRNGMPMPAIEVSEDDDINAYAIGMSPDRAIVGATRGALNKLDSIELEAVMAHEMSHIKNGDTRVKLLIVGLVTFMQLLAMILLAMVVGISQTNTRANTGKRSQNEQSGAAAVAVLAILLFALGLVFLIVGYVVGPLVQSAVSRQREYLADASGVEMTRFAPGFVSLFRKFEEEELGAGATGALSIFFTYRWPRRGLRYLFTASHPPTWKRIERMEKMAETL